MNGYIGSNNDGIPRSEGGGRTYRLTTQKKNGEREIGKEKKGTVKKIGDDARDLELSSSGDLFTVHRGV